MEMDKMDVDKLMRELENSCHYCVGGACSACHGFGFTVFRDITYPDLKTRVECTICNGTGKCPHCGGSGRVR
jgi:DnaJ-class molecular chaperone